MHSVRFSYSSWARLVTVIFVGVLCFAAASNLHAAYADEPAKQSVSSATSSISNLSADLDADELSAALDSYLSRNVDRTHEPGVAVAVVTSQGVVYMRTFGTCESAGDAFLYWLVEQVDVRGCDYAAC